jgi:hypothetical protein
MKIASELFAKYPVIVNDLRLTKKTKALTNLESYNELVEKKDTLFSKKSDAEIMQLLTEEIYGGKLNRAQLRDLQSMTAKQRLEHLQGQLTITTELIQQRESQRTDSKLGKTFNLFMGSRLNVGRNESSKYAYQTTTLNEAVAMGLVIGQNFTEMLAERKVFVYIYRVRSFEPEFVGDNVNTSPMRAGKGGDVLRKDGKLLFLLTQLVIEPNMNEAEISKTFDELYKEETDNEIAFAHTPGHEISSDDIPAEARDDKGSFSADFQNWLNETYNEGIGQQVAIKAAEFINS